MVVWSGGTAAYHSDVPVSSRWMRTPPFPCAIRITRSAPSYSWRRIDLRRWSFARPAFVTRPTTSRSPTVRRIARIDRWNSWWASPTSTSSSRNIVGRHARTARPAAVSSIFLSSISNINVVIWWHVNARATWTRGRISSRVKATRFPRRARWKSSPRFDGDGDIKAGAEGRGDRKYPARDTYSDGVTPIQWATSVPLGGCDAFRSLGASRRGGNRCRPPVLRLLTLRVHLRAFLRHHCGGGRVPRNHVPSEVPRAGRTGGTGGGARGPGEPPPPDGLSGR